MYILIYIRTCMGTKENNRTDGAARRYMPPPQLLPKMSFRTYVYVYCNRTKHNKI